jgi:hypothetical protein
MVDTSAGPARELPGRVRLSGSVLVPSAAGEPLSLFTPLGERAWAEGWDPRFPAAADDDGAPGTVFQTAHGPHQATWIVCGREAGRSIRYARIIPGVSMGLITVVITVPAGRDGWIATVSYDLTALSAAARAELARFAAGFPGFLRQWTEAIAAAS